MEVGSPVVDRFASLCRQHGHKFLAPFLAAVSSFGDDTPASTTGRRGADATPRRRAKGGADAATAPAATALSADDVEQLLTSDLIVRAHAVGTGGGGLGLDVGVGGDDDAALFDGRSASGLAINWPVVVDLLLRTRASCALSGLIVMRRCLNADGGDTDMSTRRAPPFVLEKLKPLSDTVGNTLDDLQQAATAADGELDAVLCASDAPSSNDARRQLAQQYAATLARLEQLLPVLRALLLRARRYAQLEARRGVEDMAAASRGQQSSWEAGHTVVRDAVAPWEVADQADARHVKSILRSALALLEDDLNGGFEDPAITATATSDQRFRARIEALLQHREQVMAAQAAAHKRITEADQRMRSVEQLASARQDALGGSTSGDDGGDAAMLRAASEWHESKKARISGRRMHLDEQMRWLSSEQALLWYLRRAVFLASRLRLGCWLVSAYDAQPRGRWNMAALAAGVSRRRRLAKHRHEELGDAACDAELNHDRLYAMAVDASISAGVVDTVDGRVSGVVPSPSWLLDLFTPSVQADRAAALRAGGDDGLAAGRTTAPAASMSAQGTLMKLHYLALYLVCEVAHDTACRVSGHRAGQYNHRRAVTSALRQLASAASIPTATWQAVLALWLLDVAVEADSTLPGVVGDGSGDGGHVDGDRDGTGNWACRWGVELLCGRDITFADAVLATATLRRLLACNAPRGAAAYLEQARGTLQADPRHVGVVVDVRLASGNAKLWPAAFLDIHNLIAAATPANTAAQLPRPAEPAPPPERGLRTGRASDTTAGIGSGAMATCMRWFLQHGMFDSLLHLPLGAQGVDMLLSLLRAAALGESGSPGLPPALAADLGVALLVSRGRVEDAGEFHRQALRACPPASEEEYTRTRRRHALLCAHAATTGRPREAGTEGGDAKPLLRPHPDLQLLDLLGAGGEAATRIGAGWYANTANTANTAGASDGAASAAVKSPQAVVCRVVPAAARRPSSAKHGDGPAKHGDGDGDVEMGEGTPGTENATPQQQQQQQQPVLVIVPADTPVRVRTPQATSAAAATPAPPTPSMPVLLTPGVRRSVPFLAASPLASPAVGRTAPASGSAPATPGATTPSAAATAAPMCTPVSAVAHTYSPGQFAQQASGKRATPTVCSPVLVAPGSRTTPASLPPPASAQSSRRGASSRTPTSSSYNPLSTPMVATTPSVDRTSNANANGAGQAARSARRTPGLPPRSARRTPAGPRLGRGHNTGVHTPFTGGRSTAGSSYAGSAMSSVQRPQRLMTPSADLPHMAHLGGRRDSTDSTGTGTGGDRSYSDALGDAVLAQQADSGAGAGRSPATSSPFFAGGQPGGYAGDGTAGSSNDSFAGARTPATARSGVNRSGYHTGRSSVASSPAAFTLHRGALRLQTPPPPMMFRRQR